MFAAEKALFDHDMRTVIPQQQPFTSDKDVQLTKFQKDRELQQRIIQAVERWNNVVDSICTEKKARQFSLIEVHDAMIDIEALYRQDSSNPKLYKAMNQINNLVNQHYLDPLYAYQMEELEKKSRKCTFTQASAIVEKYQAYQTIKEQLGITYDTSATLDVFCGRMTDLTAPSDQETSDNFRLFTELNPKARTSNVGKEYNTISYWVKQHSKLLADYFSAKTSWFSWFSSSKEDIFKNIAAIESQLGMSRKEVLYCACLQMDGVMRITLLDLKKAPEGQLDAKIRELSEKGHLLRIPVSLQLYLASFSTEEEKRAAVNELYEIFKTR